MHRRAMHTFKGLLCPSHGLFSTLQRNAGRDVKPVWLTSPRLASNSRDNAPPIDGSVASPASEGSLKEQPEEEGQGKGGGLACYAKLSKVKLSSLVVVTAGNDYPLPSSCPPLALLLLSSALLFTSLLPAPTLPLSDDLPGSHIC
jgi:hypothetical protein